MPWQNLLLVNYPNVYALAKSLAGGESSGEAQLVAYANVLNLCMCILSPSSITI